MSGAGARRRRCPAAPHRGRAACPRGDPRCGRVLPASIECRSEAGTARRHGCIAGEMRSRAGLAVLAVLAAACQAAAPLGTTTSSPAAVASPTASLASTATPNATSAPSLTIPPREAECNTQITGDFVLANDLKCGGDAFVIHVDNVVLDLGGHMLSGPGMGPQTWPNPQLDSVGVRVGGHTNVTVRNGTIDGFSTGIYFVDMVRSSIEDVTSQHNRYGFYLHSATGIPAPP